MRETKLSGGGVQWTGDERWTTWKMLATALQYTTTVVTHFSFQVSNPNHRSHAMYTCHQSTWHRLASIQITLARLEAKALKIIGLLFLPFC